MFAVAALHWVLTFVFLASTAFGIRLHADSLRSVREQGLPLAAELPPLNRKLAMLTQEVQLAEVQRELQSGSIQEKLRTTVLPETFDQARIISFFDVLRGSLSSAQPGDSLQIGQPKQSAYSGIQSIAITWKLRIAQDDATRLMKSVHITGLVTVADALPENGLSDLLRPIESGNPSDIVALEQFLSTDLFSYARDPKVYTDRLLQAVTSQTFADVFLTVEKSSLLPEAHEILSSSFGDALAKQKLWPSPFFTLKTLSLRTVEKGMQEVTVEVETFIRQ